MKCANNPLLFLSILHVHQIDPSLPLPPLTLRLSRYSKSAAKAILEAGGDVQAVYHNALALRQAAHPEKFLGREVKEAKPIRKTDICEWGEPPSRWNSTDSKVRLILVTVYYTNPAKYGYLAEGVAPGEMLQKETS